MNDPNENQDYESSSNSLNISPVENNESSSSSDEQSEDGWLDYVLISDELAIERTSSEPERINEDELFENYLRGDNDMDSENVERFDTDLPAEHSYFGTMSRVSGVNYLEPDKTYRIPICTHHSVVYPGETFPMLMTEFIFDGLENSTDGLVFGLLFPSIWPQTKPKMYGVTCQIYEKGNDGRGNVTIKSRVYQRFVVVAPNNDLLLPYVYIQGGRTSADVKILPEIVLDHPLLGFSVACSNKFRTNSLINNRQKKIMSCLSIWPKFVYEQYDVNEAMEKIKKYLATVKIESMPNDPVLLSFWLGRNIPLESKDKTNIFLTNSITHRILLIGKCLNYFCYFRCQKCKQNIANYNVIFAMSKHGIQSNYCNPAGYVHETLTVYNTLENSVYMIDKMQTEFSWFPGYAWQIANCKNCHHHLGWRFSSIKPNMIPRIFYGLASRNITVGANTSLVVNEE